VSVLLLFAMCLAGAVVPVAGSEILVLGAVSMAAGPWLVALVVMAAAAQSLGKLLVYGAAATGAHTRTAAGFGIKSLHAAVGRSPNRATAIVFVSALASVPPLYATTIVCGAAGHGSVRFGIAVFAARVIRYGILVAILDPVRMAF
jgi:membrane protein YqaA with SNARE-associated domain